MNDSFTDSIKQIKELYQENIEDEYNERNKINKKKFINTLVKLQNNFYKFQVRIIFTQITNVTNIINKKITDDKSIILEQFNTLLDVINKKVDIMNLYLEQTTDDKKNLIPLQNNNEYNVYQYDKNKKTGKLDIKQINHTDSIDKLKNPEKEVLKIIDRMNKIPKIDKNIDDEQFRKIGKYNHYRDLRNYKIPKHDIIVDDVKIPKHEQDIKKPKYDIVKPIKKKYKNIDDEQFRSLGRYNYHRDLRNSHKYLTH